MHAVISGDELDKVRAARGTCAVAFLDAAAFVVAAFLEYAGEQVRREPE